MNKYEIMLKNTSKIDYKRIIILRLDKNLHHLYRLLTLIAFETSECLSTFSLIIVE